MTLSRYLEIKGIGKSDFARTLGVSPAAVSRYIRNARTPRKKILLKIETLTRGEVRAEDFYR